MITERDIAVLFAVARYYVLNRHQIQQLIFPNDPDGRITRRRLQLLVDAHLLNRQQMLVCHPSGIAPTPVYYPARQGCELLAQHAEDERFLLTPTRAPILHHLEHWLCVSQTHIIFDQAISRQQEVRVEDWINEYDIANKDESAPERRFRLYTLLRDQPRLICAPDAAFLLSVRDHSKVFYLEQDRGTSGVYQIAAGKTGGYAAMAERGWHRRHFPNATVDTFTVLMISPDARRRDALRRALRDKPGASLWKFTTVGDCTPERLLHEPIVYPCDGEPLPLVRPQGATNV